jgi:predicted ATP-grasp superfamily ATP-dependent carboligase
MYRRGSGREVVVPNIIVTCAKRETGNDFVFLHLLEPHMFSELYVSSVLLLLERLGVQRYCLLGSMYDMVPHTRPLLVTGGVLGKRVAEDVKKMGLQASDYEGPTTITYLISQQAPKLGIETMTLIVHVPQYTQLDEDYMGQVRLLEVFSSLYGVPVDEADIKKAERQLKDIETAVESNPQVKEVVAQLEAHYDARTATRKETEMPKLSSEIESFLKEMEKRFRQD